MHQARAILDRDKIAQDHEMSRFLERHEGEERMILDPFELLALETLHNFERLTPENFFQQCFSQDQAFGSAFIRQRVFDRHVIHICAGGDRHVGRQGPGRGGPDQERGAGLIDQRHAHEHGRVNRVGVAHGDFMVREGRAAARTIGNDLIALEEQVAFPESLQDPPDRFDVFVGVGHVGIAHVNPKSDPVGQFLPVLDIVEDRFTAEFVEFLNAKGFDLLLIVETELLLDGDLDRQAVRVPAASARDVKPVHDLVTREHVLESARLHMVDAGFAIGSRRTFEKDEFRRTFALVNCLLKDLAVLPEL